MTTPRATVVPQPVNLIGEPSFAVLVTTAKGTTVAGLYPTRQEADEAAAAINPKPRRPQPVQPRLFAFA